MHRRSGRVSKFISTRRPMETLEMKYFGNKYLGARLYHWYIMRFDYIFFLLLLLFFGILLIFLDDIGIYMNHRGNYFIER